MGSKTEKRQLTIFIAIAYGIPYLLGLFMWYGSLNQMDLSAFPSTQMLYPAMGVMIAFLLTRKKDEAIPRAFYLCFIVTTVISIVFTILSVLMPDAVVSLPGGTMPVFSLAVQYLLAAGSIICLICLIAAGKKKRAVYGMKWKNWKASVGCVLLFVILYLSRVAVLNGLSGQFKEFAAVMTSAEAWIYFAIMPLNFLLGYIAFFGEEYGWRYYLQPLLQRKFGLRKGVLILGVVWGLWHLPLDFFYYVTPEYGLPMTVNQIINCVTLGIFLGFVYMKTENIWVPTIIHFLNNNLIMVVSGAFSADVLENNSVSWLGIPIMLLINGLLFGVFIFAKQYRRGETEKFTGSPAVECSVSGS